MGHPSERIAMDLAGPFPILRRGNRHILVVADYFSKWCEAYPVPTIYTPEITNVFVENLISYYGVLLELHIDQGRNFESNPFSELRKLLKINKTRITVLHQQSDGIMEQFNRTLLQHLSIMLSPPLLTKIFQYKLTISDADDIRLKTYFGKVLKTFPANFCQFHSSTQFGLILTKFLENRISGR